MQFRTSLTCTPNRQYIVDIRINSLDDRTVNKIAAVSVIIVRVDSVISNSYAAT